MDVAPLIVNAEAREGSLRSQGLPLGVVGCLKSDNLPLAAPMEIMIRAESVSVSTPEPSSSGFPDLGRGRVSG